MRVTAFSLLLPALVAGQNEAQVRWATETGCYFSENLGTNSGTVTSNGKADFKVAANAKTYCRTLCRGGSDTSLFNNYGGAATGTVADTNSEMTTNCGLNAEFTSTDAQTTLGWQVTSTNYESLSLVCYCTDDGVENTFPGSDGCFSESAVVQVKGKGEVAMKDLNVGDKVLTGKNTFQPVYSFGHHKEDSAETDFVQLYTGDAGSSKSEALELTGNHMVFVVDGNGKEITTRSDQVQVGDRLRLGGASGETVAVTQIDTIKKTGLFMPLTPDGTIVVNGVVASNYISISDSAPGVVEHSQMFFSMNEQTLSHWWLSPYRMLCMGVSSGFCDNGDAGASAYELGEADVGILPWLLMGRHFAHVAEHQPAFVRFVMGVPTFMLFGMFNFVEHTFFGPSMAPFLFIMVIAVAVVLKKKASNESDFQQEGRYSLLSSTV